MEHRVDKQEQRTMCCYNNNLPKQTGMINRWKWLIHPKNDVCENNISQQRPCRKIVGNSPFVVANCLRM